MPTITFGEAIRQAYREEMIRDKNVFLMGEDVGRWGSLYRSSKGLLEEFGPEQIKDAPISEAAIAGCGIGSAVMGMRPIVEIMYIDFITIAMDQIVNHAAKWHQLSNGKVKLPMVFKTQGGAGRRNSSQHSQSFENWFVNVPGLITVMPSTPYDVKGLLKSAVRDDNPVVFIEHKSLYFDKGEVPESEYLLPLGRADVKRSGEDVTVIATSWMVSFALNAAEKLQEEGISCEVVDPRTLWPLDEKTIIQSVKKTGLCLVVTEAPQAGGWSGEASAVVHEHCFGDLKKPVKRHCGMRTGIPFGPILERQVIPSEDSIAEAVRELVGPGVRARAIEQSPEIPEGPDDKTNTQKKKTMATEFTMPMLGEVMEEGRIVAWLKKEGDTVDQGEIIMEVETDKATMEVESTESGVVKKILVPEGETVPVNTPLALIE